MRLRMLHQRYGDCTLTRSPTDSVVAVVAQLPLIVLTVVAVPGSWGVGWRPTELERGTRNDPIVLDPSGKFQCIVEAAIF